MRTTTFAIRRRIFATRSATNALATCLHVAGSTKRPSTKLVPDNKIIDRWVGLYPSEVDSIRCSAADEPIKWSYQRGFGGDNPKVKPATMPSFSNHAQERILTAAHRPLLQAWRYKLLWRKMAMNFNRRDLLKGGAALSAGSLINPQGLALDQKHALPLTGSRPFQPSWNSLRGIPVPQWLRDGKFGIYTHWGVYSVPAYGRTAPGMPTTLYRPGFR